MKHNKFEPRRPRNIFNRPRIDVLQLQAHLDGLRAGWEARAASREREVAFKLTKAITQEVLLAGSVGRLALAIQAKHTPAVC